MQKPPIIHSITPAEGSHFLKTEILDLEFSNGERRIYERLKGSGLGADRKTRQEEEEGLVVRSRS